MTQLMKSDGATFDQMFLQMIVEHHEGAIEMARTEQANGVVQSPRVPSAPMPTGTAKATMGALRKCRARRGWVPVVLPAVVVHGRAS